MNEAGIFMRFLKKITNRLEVLLLGSEESTETDNRFNWYDSIRDNTGKSGVSVLSYYRKLAQ